MTMSPSRWLYNSHSLQPCDQANKQIYAPCSYIRQVAAYLACYDVTATTVRLKVIVNAFNLVAVSLCALVIFAQSQSP